MNKRFVKYLIAFCIGAIFTGADARRLAPNAEMFLSKREASPAISRDALPDTIVNAYVMFDDKTAMSELETLGVKFHADHGIFSTAAIPASVLREAGNTEGVRYIALGNEVKLLNDYSRKVCGIDNVHTNYDNSLPQPYTGKGVVIGVIDIGVEFGHLAFRELNGTGLRIKRVWNQKSSRGQAPEGFGYGSEYTTAESILALTYDSPFEYHGTHTMGIASGADLKSKYYGVAPESDLVYVAFNDDDTSLPDAIKYIFDYAESVGKPCVINMSLGQHLGPHNGTSPLDKYIDSAVGPGRIIVGAVGNEGNRRLHTSETFTESDTQLKSMLVLNKDSKNRLHYLDIWGSEGSQIKVSLCVAQSLKGKILTQTPVYDTSDDKARFITDVFTIKNDGADANIYIDGEVSPVNGQPHVMVECEVGDISEGRVLGVIVDGAAGETVHLWNYSGNEFASNGKPGWTDGTVEGTAGEIGGTARNIISVGSYDARSSIKWIDGAVSNMYNLDLPYEQNKRSFFSSCGPTADGRTVPDVLAPGFPVISAINKHAYINLDQDLSLYTCSATHDADGVSYYYSYQMGTSMSAPFVAGTVALMLQAKPDLTPQDVRSILASTSQSDEFMGALPNNYYGNGYLNSLGCVRAAVDMSGVTLPGAEATDRAKVWSDRGGNLVIAAGQGCKAEVYSSSGALLATLTLTEPIETVDATAWGSGIVIVRITGVNSAQSIKVAL